MIQPPIKGAVPRRPARKGGAGAIDPAGEAS